MARTAIKITVVGAGFVGSTVAYTLMMKGVASEIVLVDVAADKAEGEALDIKQGVPFAPNVKVYSGDYSAAKDSDLVIITAGTNQKPGETRLDMVGRNAMIMTDIAKNIAENAPNAIALIISNPVDVMSQVFEEVSSFPAKRVIGSGTNLDSARFRYILATRMGVDPHDVHGYILGEHGDSEFAAWSLISVAGMHIDEAEKLLGAQDREGIEKKTETAAYEIIAKKGATYYAIAMSAARIAEAIIRDEHAIIPLSVRLTGEYSINDIYLSLPTIVGQHGVEKILTPALTEEEFAKLQHSAEILKNAKASLAK
jgi:L-lactate dehydrogenase